MPAGPLILIALLVQASAVPPAVSPAANSAPPASVAPDPTVYGPKLAAKPAKPQFKTSAKDSCADMRASSEREIIVCAARPDGYRLNPDILEAKRELKGQGNHPNPSSDYKDHGCSVVGPFGCTGTPSINLIAAGIVLATMARRAVTGGNVGEMFITDPQKSEYQLYLEAKQRRESGEKALAAAQLAQAAREALAKSKTQAATPAAAVTPAKAPAP